MSPERVRAILASIEAMVRAIQAHAMPGTPCPACGRKGLHTPDHPHATGHKDVGRLVCRFCHAEFERRWTRN